METLTHWIGGKPTPGTSGRHGDVFDPARGEVVAQVPLADAGEVDVALTAASAAFADWSVSPLSRRTEVLFALRELVRAHVDDLARIVSTEHGKVLDDARAEVRRGLDVVEFACAAPELLKGAYSRDVSSQVDVMTVREPLGVVVGITPFNFPVMVPMWMHPIAMACGDAFVLKPSERDPSASMLVAELWAEAGLPDGVFSVVHGDGATVDQLVADDRVAAVSFVGSTPVARHVHEAASMAGKRVQALGGAKNHLVVLPDADLDLAADASASAAYGSAGERCMAVSVVVAVGDCADPLVERIAQRAQRIRVGPGGDESSEMGPLVTSAQRDRVAGYVDRGAEEGAEIVVDRRGVRVSGHDDGFWVGPCLIDHVTPDMSVYRDEIFGPVLSVVRVRTVDEALDLVNEASPYGNGVAIFTADGAAADRFQRAVDIGMVGVNVAIPVPPAYHAFGGRRSSLFGPLHVHGPEGVVFYTAAKVVATRWPDRGDRDVGFAPR